MKDMPPNGAILGKPACGYGGNAGEGARHLQGLLVESRPAPTYGSLVDVEGGSIIRRGHSGVWEDTVLGSVYVTLSSRKSLRAGVLLSLTALAVLFVAFTWPRQLTFALSRDQPTVQVISGSPSPFSSPYAPRPAETTVLKASTVVYLTNPNYFSFRITDLDVPLYDFERVYIGRAFLTLSPVYLHSRSTSVLPVSALLTMTTHETMKVAQNCWRNDRRTRLYLQGNVTMHALLVRHVVPIVHTVDVDCKMLS